MKKISITRERVIERSRDSYFIILSGYHGYREYYFEWKASIQRDGDEYYPEGFLNFISNIEELTCGSTNLGDFIDEVVARRYWEPTNGLTLRDDVIRLIPNDIIDGHGKNIGVVEKLKITYVDDDGYEFECKLVD